MSVLMMDVLVSLLHYEIDRHRRVLSRSKSTQYAVENSIFNQHLALFLLILDTKCGGAYLRLKDVLFVVRTHSL